jgi:hypothetical protein
LVTSKGNTKKSETIGYLKYTNKLLKYSTLIPEEWMGEMTIGGSYQIIPDKENKVCIAFSSSKFNHYSAFENKPNLKLEEYKTYRLSQITEDEIGPKLEYTIKETILSGIKAYKLEYTYVPVATNTKLYQIEIFTISNGRIFTLTYYANIDNYKNYLKEFTVIKNNYKILI